MPVARAAMVSLRATCRRLWALPTTLLGLLFLPPALLTGGGVQCVAGVVEVYGGVVTWLLRHGTVLPGGAAALTLGHVVLGVDRAALRRTRAHERVHVAQAERWGPLFVPVYLLIGAWLLLRRRDPYRDHPFEKQAFREADQTSPPN